MTVSKKELDQLKKLKEIARKQIPLNNDVFMIFAKNKNFCQEFLRVILRDNKIVVVENDIQKCLPTAFSKFVIIDMLCRLRNGKLVNVEIQLTKEKYHAKRILSYASKIKNFTTTKGVRYKDVKDLIIIYLTLEDIFGCGSTVYEVNMNIVSDKGDLVSKWDAGLEVYYVNTVGLTNKTINSYLKLLTDKTTLNKNYKVTSEIKDAIYSKGGVSIMSKEMKNLINEIKEDARIEGNREGMQQGKLQTLLNLVKDKLLSVKEAAKRLDISEREFVKLAKT